MKTQDRVVSDVNMARPCVIKDVVAAADVFSEVNPVARPVNSRPVNIKKPQAVEKVDDQPSGHPDGKKQYLPDVHGFDLFPPNADPFYSFDGKIDDLQRPFRGF
jgi:hypothetical protein